MLVVVAAGAYIFLSARGSNKSDEEIQKMFSCDRITADVRATDVYCNDPNLYREHLRQNEVIKSTDPI